MISKMQVGRMNNSSSIREIRELVRTSRPSGENQTHKDCCASFIIHVLYPDLTWGFGIFLLLFFFNNPWMFFCCSVVFQFNNPINVLICSILMILKGWCINSVIWVYVTSSIGYWIAQIKSSAYWVSTIIINRQDFHY